MAPLWRPHTSKEFLKEKKKKLCISDPYIRTKQVKKQNQEETDTYGRIRNILRLCKVTAAFIIAVTDNCIMT